MTNEELSNKLEEKRFEMERETYLVMEVVDGDNILEMANEMIVYRAKMEMIDEIQFMLENGVWEDELPSQIIIKKYLDISK
jgi:hypothetical protein